MDRVRLTENFHLDEFERSQIAVRLGIDTRIDPAGPIAKNIERLCRQILQPLRDALGPVHITSGYRPSKLNEYIGGAPKSAHLTGCAADIVVSGHSPRQVASWAAEHLKGYDQIILELDTWVHISIPETGSPRGEVLTSSLGDGGINYREGIS